jgi:hypothetical protein
MLSHVKRTSLSSAFIRLLRLYPNLSHTVEEENAQKNEIQVASGKCRDKRLDSHFLAVVEKLFLKSAPPNDIKLNCRCFRYLLNPLLQFSAIFSPPFLAILSKSVISPKPRFFLPGEPARPRDARPTSSRGDRVVQRRHLRHHSRH